MCVYLCVSSHSQLNIIEFWKPYHIISLRQAKNTGFHYSLSMRYVRLKNEWRKSHAISFCFVILFVLVPEAIYCQLLLWLSCLCSLFGKEIKIIIIASIRMSICLMFHSQKKKWKNKTRRYSKSYPEYLPIFESKYSDINTESEGHD